MKFIKRALWIVGILLVLGVFGYWLVGSHFLARHVAHQLSQVMGMPVRIAAIIPGYQQTYIDGVAIYAGDDPDSQGIPWMAIEQIQADVSLWDGIAGTVDPKEIHVSSAAITLRFDRAGNLTTQLPAGSSSGGDLPSIHISRSRVTLAQEGKPPLTIHAIDVDIQSDRGQLILNGSITDPEWGNWSLDGQWNDSTKQGSIRLRGDTITLNQTALDALPLVPASIWQEVNQLEGTVQAEIRLEMAGPDSKPHVVLHLQPISSTKVHIHALDLTGVITAGAITIEDAIVKLDRLVANTAGGLIDLDGELDFRQDDETYLQFQLAARSLDLTQLPRSWDLPSQITGKLSGKAQLQIHILNGQVTTKGEGKGVIDEAQLAGIPARPIELKLRPAGKRFRFVSTTNAIPVAEEDDLGEGGDDPGYLEVKLGLDQVDLAPLLEKLNIHLPFKVAGRLSFDLQVGIPTNDPRDYSAYRLQGSARMDELTLESIHLQKLLARIHYDQGILHLDELTGQVPPPHLPSPDSEIPNETGTIAGTAKVALFPPGHLTGQLRLQQIPLSQFAGLIPWQVDDLVGHFSSTFQMDVPANDLGDITAWKVRGHLQSNRLGIREVAIEALNTTMFIQDGILRLQEIQGRLVSGELTGAVSLQLQKPFRFQGQLQLLKADLALVHPFQPSLDIQGDVDLHAEAQGSVEPYGITGNARIESPNAVLQKVKIEHLRSTWQIGPGALTLTDLQAAVFQGQLSGHGKIPFQPQDAGQLELHLTNLDLLQISHRFNEIPLSVQGRTNVNLAATLSALGQKRNRDWTTRIDCQSRFLTVGGIPADSIAGTIELRQEQLDYQLQGKTLGGTLSITGRLPLSPESTAIPTSSEGIVRLERLQLQSLWHPLQLEDTLRPLQARLNGEFHYRHESDGFPVGRGSLTIRGVKWQEQSLWSEPLTTQLELTRQQLQLHLRSRFLGGQVAGRILFDLQQLRRSRFFLALDGLSLVRVLAPWSDLCATSQGQLDAFLQGSLGWVCRGRGSLTITNGRLGGINLNDLRVPLDFSYLPGNGMGQLNAQEIVVQFPSGRANGNATYNWGSDSRLEGRLRFANVDMRQAYQGSSSGALGSPVVSGKLDLNGTDLRSWDDVVLRLEATMQRTQANQSPILQQLTPYLLRINSATIFREGEIKAQLTHGLARIENLSLKSDAIRMFMEGTVTVPGQRVDLSTSVYTGNLVGGACLPGLVGLSASNAQIPLASQLVSITNRLSPFLMHFQVTGSLRTPTVQIRPLSALSVEAARFFSR